jgi:DNA-binding CsgD family transcriptional regulator
MAQLCKHTVVYIKRMPYKKPYAMNHDLQMQQFFDALITNTPADLTTPEALHYKNTLHLFEQEAMYIYSLKDKKLIYTNGWQNVLGYKDEEINMDIILNSTIPEYAPFSQELNYKVLLFIHTISEDLEKYSFSMELKKRHKNGTAIPIVSWVGVHQVQNKQVVTIYGNFRVNHNLTFGRVMRYATYGPEKNTMEEELSKNLFYSNFISDKEKEVLALVAKGQSFKEIATLLHISTSAVEKRINPLYKRFHVNGIAHLVSFAYENHILP